MFELVWLEEAREKYVALQSEAQRLAAQRQQKGSKKSSKAEGLFKQVHKTLSLLQENPRHPGLQTHKFRSIEDPYDSKAKVFEAYAKNRTPGAYRVFWCYGPSQGQLTVIAITPHP